MELRILHLHPSVLNVAGDGGNVRALEQRARWRDIPVDIRRTDPGESIDPAWADITLIGGGQDIEMRVAAAGLREQAHALRDSVAGGAPIFANSSSRDIGQKRLLVRPRAFAQSLSNSTYVYSIGELSWNGTRRKSP